MTGIAALQQFHFVQVLQNQWMRYMTDSGDEFLQQNLVADNSL
jgi:hypothetical protein